MATRRVAHRQFLLRPDAETNEIVEYCMAEAAKRFAIGLIAWAFLSNHFHLVAYDEKGQLPAFLEHMNKLIAKCLNARWGRSENLWSSDPVCITELVTADAVFDKVAYVLANPVSGGLVDRVGDWPGATSLSLFQKNKCVERRRPKRFFRKEGKMPKTVKLRTVPVPRSYTNEPHEEWVERMLAEIVRCENEQRQIRNEEKRRVVGRKTILAQSPFDAPTTEAKSGGLRPAIACKDEKRRIIELALLREFRRLHRIAREVFAAGNRDAEFPPGTYRQRLLGCRCAPFPLAA